MTFKKKRTTFKKRGSNRRYIAKGQRGNRPCPSDTLPKNFDNYVAKTAPGRVFNYMDVDNLIKKSKSSLEKIMTDIRKMNQKTIKNAKLLKKALIKKKHKVNTTIMTQLKIIIQQEKDQLEADIVNLSHRGMYAKVESPEGKIRQLILIIKHYCDLWEPAPSMMVKKVLITLYLKMKDPRFTPSSAIMKEHSSLFTKFNEIITGFDLVKEQHLELYDQLSPLHEKGFTKLDSWQVKCVELMNKSVNQIVSAPTSSGKTALALYAAKFGKVLFVGPKEAIAIQVAGAFSKIYGEAVPLVTDVIGDIIDREEIGTVFDKKKLYQKYNNASALVVTPEKGADILPYLDLSQYKYVVFDEIHCLNDEEIGQDIERIFKITAEAGIPFLALSATIGNLDWLKAKTESITKKPVETIVCKRRFFNLQSGVYDSTAKEIVTLNPLAMINPDEFEDKSILVRSFQQTPPDAWELYTKLISVFSEGELGNLQHTIYYDTDSRLELGQTAAWFHDQLKFMVEKYHENETNKHKIIDMVNSFKKTQILTQKTKLYEFLMVLKKEDMLPAIVFQKDRIEAMRIASTLLDDLKNAEETKYPNLIKEREAAIKQAKAAQKQLDRLKLDDMGEKKLQRTMEKLEKEGVFIDIPPQLNEPHIDFCMQTSQYVPAKVKEWSDSLKKYFPPSGDDDHIFIQLLRRGIGLYIKGLPLVALLLVQSLANKGDIKVVISDDELAYGVSMPFRTSVIVKSPNDDLNSLECNQMKGRAGRRGIDTRGFVIFLDYEWDRIIELNTSPLPHIVGREEILCQVSDVASAIAKKNGSSQDWACTHKNTFAFHQLELDDKNLDEEEKEFAPLQEWANESVASHPWILKEDVKHNALVWQLRRFPNEAIVVPYIIPYLVEKFGKLDPTVKANQVNIGSVLANFICTREATPEVLEKYQTKSSLNEFWRNHFSTLKNEHLISFGFFDEEEEIDMEEEEIDVNDEESVIPDFDFDTIDQRVVLSLRNNKLFETTDEMRNWFSEFAEVVRLLQNYCYYAKVPIVRLLGKLYTRIWWIRHNSSPFKSDAHMHNESV